MTRSGRVAVLVAGAAAGCSPGERYSDGVVELDVAELLASPVTVSADDGTTTLEVHRADGVLERAVLWVYAEVELDGPVGCDGPGLLSATLSLYPLEGAAQQLVDELSLTVAREEGGSIDLWAQQEQPWEPEPVGRWSGGADGGADCERTTRFSASVSLDWVFDPR